MIHSTVGAASSLLLTGRAGWPGLHVKPPPFTGRWHDQESLTWSWTAKARCTTSMSLRRSRLPCHRPVVRLPPGMSRRRSSAS